MSDTKSITAVHAIIRKDEKTKKIVRKEPGTTFDCPTDEANGYIAGKAATAAVVTEKPAKKAAAKKPAAKKPAAPAESAEDKTAREAAEAAAAVTAAAAAAAGANDDPMS